MAPVHRTAEIAYVSVQPYCVCGMQLMHPWDAPCPTVEPLAVECPCGWKGAARFWERQSVIVACSECGEPTRDPEGVCYDCRPELY